MRVLVQILVVLLILGGAGAAAVALVRTRPAPARLTDARLPPLVEVLTVANRSEAAALRARGTLMAPNQPAATAQVAGVVAWLADGLRPGVRVAAGAELVRLDPADRQLAVERAGAELAAAEAAARVDRTLAVDARLAAAAKRARTKAPAKPASASTPIPAASPLPADPD